MSEPAPVTIVLWPWSPAPAAGLAVVVRLAQRPPPPLAWGRSVAVPMHLGLGAVLDACDDVLEGRPWRDLDPVGVDAAAQLAAGADVGGAATALGRPRRAVERALRTNRLAVGAATNQALVLRLVERGVLAL